MKKPKELVIPVIFEANNTYRILGELDLGESRFIIYSTCRLGRKFKRIFGSKDGMKLEIVVRKRRD